ncbi:hypothetical protein SEUCBS139899_001182 [Sporothrix eucalyptigena]|uniref:Uncharacterized protein n=1 Tax=Sporothrix eucalyptigena TaxID=1812306 RepID=A0ABP0BRM1_9PEZI
MGTVSTTATSTTSSGFVMQAYGKGILDLGMWATLSDLSALGQRLGQPPDTPSPPESQYELYAEAVQAAETEATIVSQVERLVKHSETKGPDMAEGLSMNEYGRCPVHTRARRRLVCRQPPFITLPCLAGELKGTGKYMRRAALFYARNNALAYL